MNSKKNSKIGDLAENVDVAIAQEKCINQDIYNVKGVVFSNIANIGTERILEPIYKGNGCKN